jgi:hypothetical protein
MGIIPDRIILLNQGEEFTKLNIKENLIATNMSLSDQQVEEFEAKMQ